MSENQYRGNRDFSMYDTMQTEELEKILRLDCEADEGETSDTELLLYVMGVLARRKRNSEKAGKTAQQAWESFQANYLTAENGAPEAAPIKFRKTARPWLRRAIAAAAVIVLLIAVPVAASAFGWENVWNVVATWAKETFSFVTGDWKGNDTPNSKNTNQYTALQEALMKTAQRTDVVPTWIPDGYELVDIFVGESPQKSTYDAIYKKEEAALTVSVQVFSATIPEWIEIEDEPIEIYEASGVKYYIFENVEKKQIIWQIDSYECHISCELTIEEIKKMIDSIGKG